MAAPRGPAVSTHAELGVRLFRALAEGAGGRNLFVSPVSAGMALTLAYNGATGDARDEMARALGFGAMALDEVNAAQERLHASLEDTDVELEIANSLWMRAGWPFALGFLERARGAFAAEAATVDFADPATAERINAWASEATSGRIPEIAPFPFPPALTLLLANAVYFKGRWSQPFAAAATRDRPFRTADGRVIQHPLMEREGWFGYHEGDGFRALRMPYGDDRFALYALLPDEGADVAAFVRTLSAERLDAVFRAVRDRDVIISFPRFTLRGKVELIEPLRALGMRAPFAAGTVAFGDLFPPELLPRVTEAYIGEATQRTFVEVNEEGTEAAAVTSLAVAAGMGAAEPPTPVRFTADRPFVVAIRDDRTGALLFLGQVTDPAAEE